MFLRFYVLATVVEHLTDLTLKGRKNSGVEECVKTCKDYAADDNADDDLDTGVDIALTCGGLDGGLCGNYCGIALVLDGVEKLLHS